MNHKYKHNGCDVVVYDEFEKETRRVVESDIESTLKQENILEILENKIQEEQENLILRETSFEKKMNDIKKFFLIAGILGISTGVVWSFFPFHLLSIFILVPTSSFVLTGLMVSGVTFLSSKIEYKKEKKKILQKIIYCQNRKEVELKKLEQITKEKSQNVGYILKEKNLYYKDTVREMEMDVQNHSASIFVPKRRIRSKKPVFPHS